LLTPLAAVVYFISALGHQKLEAVIKTLLTAGANYNLVTTWHEQRGYAGNTTIERSTKTKLFDLDNTGLFNRLVEQHRQSTLQKK